LNRLTFTSLIFGFETIEDGLLLRPLSRCDHIQQVGGVEITENLLFEAIKIVTASTTNKLISLYVPMTSFDRLVERMERLKKEGKAEWRLDGEEMIRKYDIYKYIVLYKWIDACHR
ncbi:hypothetical protein PFISCL1PPCAC_17025, partial [Pristionchus fissidentatus]